MNQAPITFITLNGLHTAQVDTGEGDPILLLHGWGANIDLMWPLAERLLPLGYRVLVPDLPGFGKSDPPPSAWTVHDYAAHVLAYLSHHGLEQVYLVGHSFGGRLGLVLGAEQGQRIKKMVLIDSAGIRKPDSTANRARLAAYKAVRDGLAGIGLKGLSNRLRQWYTNRYGSSDFKSAGVLRETFVKVVNEDLLPYAAKVKPSTLLLWGENDEDTPLWMGQQLEKTIPDAGLHVFPGAGHYSYLEKLPDTARIIDYFFRH